MQYKHLKNRIERWIDDVAAACDDSDAVSIVNVANGNNTNSGDLKIEEVADSLQCIQLDTEEKENIVKLSKNSVDNGLLKNTCFVDKCDFDDVQDAQVTSTNQESIDDDQFNDEIIADYYRTVSNYGYCEYWKNKSGKLDIGKKLNPQCFQNHVLNPSYIKHHCNDFSVHFNSKCPVSASDKDLEHYQLLKNENLKYNAITCKYKRVKCNNLEEVDLLCRMCPAKRWIPEQKFTYHMYLAHGVIKLNRSKILVLPLPTALFKMSPGRMKCYYAKCPKCCKWVRLGRLEPFPTHLVSKEVLLQDSIYDDEDIKDIVGLYTNYFCHFVDCSSI